MNTNTISNKSNIQELTNQLLNSRTEKQLLHSLADDEWQEIFLYLKQKNIPSTEKILKRNVHMFVVQRNWNLTDNENVKTLDEYYCDTINSTLKTIRRKYKTKASIDYVYHTNNIVDLLRFEPDMKSMLVHDDGCTYFEVWL